MSARAAAMFCLLAADCYTTADAPPVTFDRCGTGRVIDGCDVSDFPPLIAMLPPWPFPSLLQPIPAPAAPPPAETPASRLLHKLTK